MGAKIRNQTNWYSGPNSSKMELIGVLSFSVTRIGLAVILMTDVVESGDVVMNIKIEAASPKEA